VVQILKHWNRKQKSKITRFTRVVD